MMVRLMGLPTRETNSSHASSSPAPAQRQTTSFRDKDEYRVGLGMLDILLFMVRVAGVTRWIDSETPSRLSLCQDEYLVMDATERLVESRRMRRFNRPLD
jgi:hypothetical protein